MAHHTHFSHLQTVNTDHIFEPQTQWHDSAYACPGALVDRIDRWLWFNVFASLCALAGLLASTGHHWLILILTLLTSTIKPKTKTKILRSQKPMDRATALTIAALILAGLFYTSVLLVLSRRERYIIKRASAASARVASPTIDEDPIDALEDAADENNRVTERESVVFLMLVVCQNGLAALLLYVGIRVMFFLKSSPATEVRGWSNAVYIELGYTIGQVALMTFVIVHCTMQDDKLGEYLRARQGSQSAEKRLGWEGHEGDLETY